MSYTSKNYKTGEMTVNGKMKESELEGELSKWRHIHFHGRRDADATGEYLERTSQLDLARHFFELGMTSKYEVTHDDTPLTDFEKAFQGMCCDKNKQFAKECCTELIALARKQIQPHTTLQEYLRLIADEEVRIELELVVDGEDEYPYKSFWLSDFRVGWDSEYAEWTVKSVSFMPDDNFAEISIRIKP